MKQWRHYQPPQSRAAFLITGPRCLTVQCEIGRVTTGSQRVFHAHYVAVMLPHGKRVVGEDRYSLIEALKRLNGELEQAGYRLLATGLDDRFHETKSSAGAGFGTVTGYEGWFHIMDAPPYPRTRRANSTGETLSGQIGVS
ncbi:hypothetical protein [Erythrobacter westpacificensis]|uniref:hypothetical protein n=1 Tax=Erythrobacter westpacificensis TaxID=1055231 RepID=UPI0031F770A9